MKAEVTQKKKNPLMNREEVWLEVDHSEAPTPSRRQLLTLTSKTLKAKEENLIIDKIMTRTGKTNSRVRVYSYKNKKDIPQAKLDKMERRMSKGEKPEEEASKESEKKPEKKPEDSEEKKKEETKAEEEKKSEDKSGPKKEEPKEEDKSKGKEEKGE